MRPNSYADVDETIAAVASPAGAGARGIIRLSGPGTLELLNQFLHTASPPFEPHPIQARRYELRVPIGADGIEFPLAVYLWPGVRSYTGQMAAELHTLGASPLLEKILSCLFELGARPARAGEFTLRSFLAGRISLVQAEAVLGVIDADSDRQLDQALEQLAGGISRRMRDMRDQLLDDLGDLEAGLDFVEEDIDFVHREEFHGRLTDSRKLVRLLLESTRQRMHQAATFRVVLAGLPNAGKSTLFNALTDSQAIVSDQAGTTTDYLIGELRLDAHSIAMFDTAGWEQTQNPIGQIAQQMRHQEYQQANLICWCSAADFDEPEQQTDQAAWEQIQSGGIPAWRVITKADRRVDAAALPEATLSLSVVEGNGLEQFKTQLARELEEKTSSPWELLGSTAARCDAALKNAGQHLQTACELAADGSGDEFLAEELRAAIGELGLILGHVYTDDLLDRVFSKFCIGK